MKKVTTISIGIPAYNEEANIGQLLRLLLSQKGNNFLLQKIFVISDGSSDNTAKKVAAIGSNKIYFKDDKKRLGKSARLEEICKRNMSDVLIFIDADVTFKDAYLLAKLINRVDFEKTGIVAINAQPLPPVTFFEHSLDASVYVAKRMAEKWNNGDNYLSFKGCFLALSGAFVKNLHIPAKLTNNDAYLYFAAKKEGFKAAYVKDCHVFYKSPITLADHIKQSSRFQASKDELQTYFPSSLLSYTLPKNILYESIGETFLKKPLYFISYLVIYMVTKMRKQTVTNPTWKIAHSTKQKIALSN